MVGRDDLRGMQDAWKAYIDLALGVTDASRKRATQVVRDMVGRGNATAEQAQAMAEEVLRAGLANRESLTRLVRFELDRTLGRVGLATAEEVADLTERVRDLERQLREARAVADTAAARAAAVPEKGAAPVKAAVPGKATASGKATTSGKATASGKVTAPAKSTAPGKKAAARKKTVSGSAAGTGGVASQSPASSVAKQAVAKKVVAKKAAKKATKSGSGVPPAGGEPA